MFYLIQGAISHTLIPSYKLSSGPLLTLKVLRGMVPLDSFTIGLILSGWSRPVSKFSREVTLYSKSSTFLHSGRNRTYTFRQEPILYRYMVSLLVRLSTFPSTWNPPAPTLTPTVSHDRSLPIQISTQVSPPQETLPHLE